MSEMSEIKSYVCQRHQRWFELHCVCNTVCVGDVEDMQILCILKHVGDVRDRSETEYT